jgi:hypothetical protein
MKSIFKKSLSIGPVFSSPYFTCAGAIQKISGFLCLGVFGVLSFFQSPEDPSTALNRLATLITNSDSGGIMSILHPDMVVDNDGEKTALENFLKRLPKGKIEFDASRVNRRFRDPENQVDRFEGSISFRTPSQFSGYPDSWKLEMEFFWILDNNKWWLERLISVNYTLESTESYPTQSQEEVSTRLMTALEVLATIPWTSPQDTLNACLSAPKNKSDDYKDLENLYFQEKTPRGIDPDSSATLKFLKIASGNLGQFFSLYQGDFKSSPKDIRRPVPWDVYKNCVDASCIKGRHLSQYGRDKEAEIIYLSIMGFGGQIVDEGAGVQSTAWGLEFQKRAIEGMLRMKKPPEHLGWNRLAELLKLISRRLDLVQTTLACLDDMTNYNSLKAAQIAAKDYSHTIFGPWAINCLAVFSTHGAPACADAIKACGDIVIVKNAGMQSKAAETLDAIASSSAGPIRFFINFEKQYVKANRIYGAVREFH